MLNQANIQQHQSYLQNATSNPLHYVSCPQNIFDKSQIVSVGMISSKMLSDLNSFSLKNFIFAREAEDSSQNNPECFSICEQRFTQDPLYNVLSLQRGNSQLFFQDQIQSCQAYQYFAEEPTSLNHSHSQKQTGKTMKNKMPHRSIDDMPFFEDSQQDSKNQASTFSNLNLPLMSQKKDEAANLKISTKNVTKNMGKLLFKYIWKNRMEFKKKFEKWSNWEDFIRQIKTWKKQNNITREFLITRWHSSSQNSKLFRIISHQFFRQKCLSAIFDSKIEMKEMHIKRLKRFQDATSNPKGLDNLN